MDSTLQRLSGANGLVRYLRPCRLFASIFDRLDISGHSSIETVVGRSDVAWLRDRPMDHQIDGFLSRTGEYWGKEHDDDL
jgi:hypothetical protein